MLEINNLTFYQGKSRIFNDVSISIKENSITGLIGPNGSGKSTLLKLCAGVYSPKQGEILFKKEDIFNSLNSFRSKISFLPEKITLYNKLTAYENVFYFCLLQEISTSNIEIVLDKVGLSEVSGNKVKEFSLGMKRLLTIAIAILRNPQILILDEPTNGLDLNNVLKIRKIIADLNKNYNTTIIISSHNLEEIRKISTELLIVNDQKVIRPDVTMNGEVNIEEVYNNTIKKQ